MTRDNNTQGMPSRDYNHEEALDAITGTAQTITLLSYEEAIRAYFVLRGLQYPPQDKPEHRSITATANDIAALWDGESKSNTAQQIDAKDAVALTVFNQGETNKSEIIHDGRIGDLFWFSDSEQKIIRTALSAKPSAQSPNSDTHPELIWKGSTAYNPNEYEIVERSAKPSAVDVEALKKEIISWAFAECQPNRGDVFSWLDDNIDGLIKYLSASGHLMRDWESEIRIKKYLDMEASESEYAVGYNQAIDDVLALMAKGGKDE